MQQNRRKIYYVFSCLQNPTRQCVTKVKAKLPLKKLVIINRLFFFAPCLTKKKEKPCLTLQQE